MAKRNYWRKKKLKKKKPRNFFAISAWFRKSGAMKNRKKERLKKLSRGKVKIDD